MADLDLSYLSIAEASRQIEAKALSPVALAEAAFARIALTDPQVHALLRAGLRRAHDDAPGAEPLGDRAHEPRARER